MVECFVVGGRKGKIILLHLSRALNSNTEQPERHQLPRACTQWWCGTRTQCKNFWILFCSLNFSQVLHDWKVLGFFSFPFNTSFFSRYVRFWLSSWSQWGLSTHLSLIPCFLGNKYWNQDEIQHFVLYCQFLRGEVCSIFTESIAHAGPPEPGYWAVKLYNHKEHFHVSTAHVI